MVLPSNNNNILIVDDNSNNSTLLEGYLSNAGFKVNIAQNAKEGLDKINKINPNLVITNVNMPVKSGFQFAEAMRNMDQLQQLPILFVSSAYGDVTTKIIESDTGGNDYIVEPVDKTELLFKVQILLRNRRMYDDLSNARKSLKESENRIKSMEKQLTLAAITDNLTGLYNRHGFFTIADQQCRLADQNRRTLTLLYINLDDMKAINDRLGHSTGDLVLINNANNIKESFSESDIISRIGGDKFAVLLSAPSPDTDSVILNRLENSIAKYNKLNKDNFNISISMGTAHFNPEQPCSLDVLVTKADASMNEQKKLKLQPQNLSASSIAIETRRYERVDIDDVYMAEVDGAGKVLIQNISMGGICVKSHEPMPLDNTYSIKMMSPDDTEVVSRGTVVWTMPIKDRTPEDMTVYETGLQFTNISSSVKKSLEKLIAYFADI